MKRKTMWILLGSTGGLAMLGVGAALIWNCKQMKRMRLIKRTGKLLYRVGGILQTVSGCVEN